MHSGISKTSLLLNKVSRHHLYQLLQTLGVHCRNLTPRHTHTPLVDYIMEDLIKNLFPVFCLYNIELGLQEYYERLKYKSSFASKSFSIFCRIPSCRIKSLLFHSFLLCIIKSNRPNNLPLFDDDKTTTNLVRTSLDEVEKLR